MSGARKTPMRRCTGCLEMKEKRGLIRVVRTDEGFFSLDFTGKKSGRGAYLCPDAECLGKAFKHKGFERSFKSAVPPEIYAQLKAELERRETP